MVLVTMGSPQRKDRAMAPRTREQQDEYNAKRRADNAAKKTGAQAKLAKLAKKGAKRVEIEPKRKAHKPAKKTKPERQTFAKAKPGTPKIKGVDDVINVSAEAAVKDTAARKVIGQARTAPPDKTVVAPEAQPIVVQDGKPQEHTMARSYLRSGKPGLGKLRNGTYQTTVSFTETQMKQVVAAAEFRAVSLAEMIRSCVVAHLNKGST